jgi:crossover junction endonuclease MUS81
MIKCPLKFKHPSESQNLQGIGPKLADWLTEKLRAHCDENGLPMPTKSRKDAKRRAELADLGQPEEQQSPERQAKKSRKTKEYVPVLRSGAYGIIMALASIPEGAQHRGLSKSDLQREAQPYSDSSFTVPSDPTKFYTAWKSIDTLLNKELVCIVGKPVSRYVLTDEGWEVAKRIKAVEGGTVPSPTRKAVIAPDSTAARNASFSGDRSASGVRVEVQDAIFSTRENSYAAVATGTLQVNAPARENRCAAATRSIAQDAVTNKSKRTQASATTESHPMGPSARGFCKAPVIEITDLTSSPEPSPERARSLHTQNSISMSGFDNASCQQNGQTMTRPPSDHVSHRPGNGSSFPVFDPIVLPQGSFDVRLILDNREVRTVTDRDYISSELQKHGITPIIRPLELGDALWIAEIKKPYDEGFLVANPDDEGEGKREIVLDYIMERKRLDDLISSIKDGRLHEQKFRLRKSGVKNVIYLVEEFSISSEREDKYGEALESAIAGMQIVDGFFVKQTAKLDDTVAYLASMTQALKGIYEQRDLRIIPSKTLDIQSYASTVVELRKKNPETNHYITFVAFNLMCTKSDSLTLRDVYLKMLMCIRGVTGEKAMEIQKKWPTPRALVEAFESANGAKAKETLISDQLGGLIPRKKIAKGLSAKIAEVWA